MSTNIAQNKPATVEQVLLNAAKNPEMVLPALIEILSNKLNLMDKVIAQELSGIKDRLGTLESNYAKTNVNKNTNKEREKVAKQQLAHA